jgi:hypothetical protein
MSDFIRDGGFGMFPTMLFGALAVLSALVIALKPERRFIPLVAVLGITTFGSGMLGTVMGVINTLRYVARTPEADRMTIVMVGAAESLNNMVLSLVLVVLTALIASVAAARIALSQRVAANSAA